jgi:transposase
MPRAPLASTSGNETRRKELTPIERERIITAAEWGATQAQICDRYNFKKSTVRETLAKAGSRIDNQSAPRSGRPKLSTERDERHILRVIRANPKLKWEDVQKECGREFSKSTYRRILAKYNISKWRAKKRPALMEAVANG